MIDFKTWAEHIILIAQENGTAHEEIERALEQAYNQGYHLGLNNGWAIEQDKDYECCEACDDYCDIQADLAYEEYLQDLEGEEHE